MNHHFVIRTSTRSRPSSWRRWRRGYSEAEASPGVGSSGFLVAPFGFGSFFRWRSCKALWVDFRTFRTSLISSDIGKSSGRLPPISLMVCRTRRPTSSAACSRLPWPRMSSFRYFRFRLGNAKEVGSEFLFAHEIQQRSFEEGGVKSFVPLDLRKIHIV